MRIIFSGTLGSLSSFQNRVPLKPVLGGVAKINSWNYNNIPFSGQDEMSVLPLLVKSVILLQSRIVYICYNTYTNRIL